MTKSYALSLHDALPIFVRDSGGMTTNTLADSIAALRSRIAAAARAAGRDPAAVTLVAVSKVQPDRKSTRLNSSHLVNSYAVFCLKKKTIRKIILHTLAI